MQKDQSNRNDDKHRKQQPVPAAKQSDTAKQTPKSQTQPPGREGKPAKTEMPPSAEHRGVEGEGSYQGTRQYDQHASDFARSGKVDESAREARRAVDTDPQGMKQAENDARKGPKH